MKMKKIFLTLLLALALVAGLAVTQASATATANVSISDLTSPPGAALTAPILITNVENYGTGTIKLEYNSSVVHVTDVTNGPQSTLAAPPNIDNTSGIVNISALNLAGISGDVIFANVTFKAVGSAGSSTSLNLSVITLYKLPDYEDIPVIIKNGSFSILSPPTPFFISGYVFYDNGTPCNDPFVNLTNLNTSKEWVAETSASSNYHQLVLANDIDINASEVLLFNFTNPARSHSNTTSHTVTLEEINLGGLFNFNTSLNPNVFDTGPGTYPSIFGVHTGNFTPKYDITVHQIYTYPCAGTGGHSERVILYDGENEIINVSWNGYQGDYHNLTVSLPVMLSEGKEYGYEIKTGSYPQIIHSPGYENNYGIITCTEFIDANGKRYCDWIPAIKLF